MKTKTVFVYVCTLVICITITKNTLSQQAKPDLQNPLLHQVNSGQAMGNFTAKVFMAPNKTYGYDIFSNGKLIYHQAAFSRVPGDNDIVITREEQANRAAIIAIEKIKKRSDPELTDAELRKVVAH